MPDRKDIVSGTIEEKHQGVRVKIMPKFKRDAKENKEENVMADVKRSAADETNAEVGTAPVLTKCR